MKYAIVRCTQQSTALITAIKRLGWAVAGGCWVALAANMGKDAIPVRETATLWWDDELAGIRYIDQTLLPVKYAIVRCTSV